MAMSEHDNKRRDGLWKLEDVASYLGVHENTVRNRMKDNGLPHSYVGTNLRFVPSEVRAWLDRQPGSRAA